MLSRMRTFGMRMPISAATFCRTRCIAVEQIAAAVRDRPAESGRRRARSPSDRPARIVLDPLLRRLARPRLWPARPLLRPRRFVRRVSISARPTQPPPSASSGIVGKLVNIRMPRKPPVTASACGREKSCCMNSPRQVRLLRAARDEQAGGQRNQERRHLAHQAVADRQLA